MASHHADTVEAELFVRSLCPRGQRGSQRAVVAAVEALVERGVLGDFCVWVTGERVPARPEDLVTEYGSQLQERVALFEEWARDNGLSLGSVFERRSVSSAITGEDFEALRLPSMVLAEYEGEHLRFVAPCRFEGRTVSVTDRLAQLQGETAAEPVEPTPLERARPAAAVERSRRPLR